MTTAGPAKLMSSKAIGLETSPEPDRFRDQMQAFSVWRDELSTLMRGFQDWLIASELGTPEIEVRIRDALHSLKGDQLSIAFVAEFSRGKTELINAIFFADLGRRLLPSDAGRTTMCPTELFYDREADEAYLRLLPIETRLSDLSLAELKTQSSHWTRLPLDMDDPEQIAATCQEVVRTKAVPAEEAERLGLHEPGDADGEAGGPETVEVPVWRHAMISFPHPLLQQGLVILDTPGLNALGSEPELTINMLPSAQAVLFVLSADTGVTRSDLDMWQNHITAFRNRNQKGLVAVLNKIDTLWDEMKEPAEVEATIREQCAGSAELLEIAPSSVYPVSAQKALVARIRGDADLLRRSNLPALESLLGDDILPQRQQVIWDNIVALLERSIDEVETPLLSRLEDLESQLNELSAIRNNRADVVQQLLVKAREKKDAYHESVKAFQLSRKKLALQARTMFSTMDLATIDRIIERTRQDMSGSWTTVGMKNGMAIFFDSMRDAMQISVRQAEETFKLIQAIYQRFHDDFGLRIPEPHMLSIQRHAETLDLLYLKAEEFRNSPSTTMTEQSFVVRRFFVSLVAQARQVFVDANAAADTWLKELVNPLVREIQAMRDSTERHLKTLGRIRESRDSLDAQREELESMRSALGEKRAALADFQANLRANRPARAEAP